MAPVSLGGVDLNLLVALEALLSERSVTRAAARLSLGQPAMSGALARLRRQLGDQLLVREGRHSVLTTFAQSLVVPVRDALAAADLVFGVRASFDPASAERSFAVVASDYVSLVLLRPLLAALAVEAPRVRLNVFSAGPDDGDRLRSGSADLVIYPTDLATDYAEFSRRLLFEDRFVLAADRDNTAVDGRLDVDRFSALPYLGVRGPVASVVESQLDVLGVARNTQVMTPSFVTAPLMLTGTQLVALVAEKLAEAVAQAAHLRLVASPVPLRPLVEAMYWDPRHTEEPGHRWLRQRLVDQAIGVQ